MTIAASGSTPEAVLYSLFFLLLPTVWAALSRSDQDFTISLERLDRRSAHFRRFPSRDGLALRLLSFTRVNPRWRVVVIDDHAPSKAAVADAVAAMGGLVAGAGSSAAEAPALVEHYRPDVAILAVGLPDGDGVAVARALMDRSPCPIVLLTSRTRAAGIMAFLVKPLRSEELAPALELAVVRFREFEALRKENEDLKRAVESRKLVERAKAVLMEREGLTEAEAFRRIQKAAMDARKPMAVVAEAILLAKRVAGR